MEKQIREIINAVNQLMLIINKRMKTCKSANDMKTNLNILNQLLDIQNKLTDMLPPFNGEITITVSPDAAPKVYTAPPLPADTVIALYMAIVEPWSPPGIEGTYAYAAPFNPGRKR